jgi:protein bicaudal C
MAETNCHIHFPDSNRSNPNEKSNQVSIAGEMAGVERARARVRELTPLLFNFDLPIVPSFQAAPDTNSPFLRAIQDQYNIQIMFRQKQKNFHTTTVVVKGCEWECSRVKEATLLLMDNLCTGLAGSVPVVMLMEISPQHHGTVLGRGNINLKIVMQRTNTVIIFPDAGDPNIPPIKKGSVTISGAIHNVYLARQLLLGSLPVVMMFDLPESLEIEEATIGRMQEEQDVTISIKPKARQTNKSCIIKTQERNCGGMYVARHALLQLDRAEEPLIRAEIPETYKVPLVGSSSNAFMAVQPPSRGPYLNVNTQLANSLGTSPLSPSYPPCTPGYTPSLARHQSPWRLPPPPPPSTPVGGLCGLPPNHPFLQDYAMLVLGNMTRLQQQQQQQEAELREQGGACAVSPSPGGTAGGLSGHGSSGLGSSLQSSPLRRSPGPSSVPRNSSPVNAGGNLTAHAHKIDLTTGSSGIGDGGKSNSSIPDLSAILSELSVGDRRAPGCEKKVVAAAATAADYEQKRQLAARAVGSRPEGEPRVPHSTWSGLGFSTSMPEAVMKELEHKKAREARERHVASNSDWFGHSAFDSMVVGKDGGLGDGLTVLLASQGLSKSVD